VTVEAVVSADKLFRVHDFEAAAKSVVPTSLFEFIAGGSEDEVTLRENRAAFDRWRLLPRVMRGITAPSTSTTVLGTPVQLPILISSMGLHRLAHDQGEVATAAAAKQAGTIFTLSCAASCPLDEVAAQLDAWWFQIYLMADRGLTHELVARAEAAGASAIVLTVDVPVRGRREADIRNDFALPTGITMPNLLSRVSRADAGNYFALAAWESAINWADLDRLAASTKLTIVIKGILAADDARIAVHSGAKGIQVSNHGGRQLDSAIASLDALPAIVAAVGDSADIVLDGGIRRGTDVLKALALGARAVLIGRPALFGLATAGQAGVERVLELLRNELRTDMILCGLPDLESVTHDLIVRSGEPAS
jgi:4-hydroxymandelate oxidase